MAYTPMKLTARMPGTISQPGTDSTLEKTRTIGTFMMNNITLAMNSDAIKPQTNSGLVSNSTGPGVMLYRVSAPIITAVVPEPGTPSVSMGTNEPIADDVAAASRSDERRVGKECVRTWRSRWTP